MSFASASAARQKDKDKDKESGGVSTDRPNAVDDTRPRFDRFGPRAGKESEARDKDYDRPRNRFGQFNGQHEEDLEGRPRRGFDHDKNKDQKDGGVILDAAGNRRNGPRGKFEQPWFKESSKLEAKDATEIDGMASETRGGWRERERERRPESSWNRDTRDARPERDPSWMQDSAQDEGGHTMEDFAKWKESMKAAHAAQDEPVMDGDKGTFAAEETKAAPSKDNEGEQQLSDGPIFGVWGGARREVAAEQSVAKMAKPKSSRFANFFAPPQPEDTSPAPPPPDAGPNPPPGPRPVSATAEDQEGFQRFMGMLRLAGSSSRDPQRQGLAQPPPGQVLQAISPGEGGLQSSDPAVQSFARPPVGHSPREAQSVFRGPSHDPQQHRGPRPPSSHLSPGHVEQPQIQRRGESMNNEIEHGFPVEPSRIGAPLQRPETAPNRPPPPPASRDSEFLLKLMQQPRPAFSESQIYGQNYQKKDSVDMTSNYNIGPRPQEPRISGPPPGFSDSKQVFAPNQGIDLRSVGEQNKGTPRVPDGFASAPPQNQKSPTIPFDGNQFDARPPWAGGRPGEYSQSTPNVPPGFGAARGPAPPGLPPFPGPHQAGQHPQQPQGPINMRGPMQQPPNFFNGPPSMQGLPPGFPPLHMNNMAGQQRRPPMPMPMGHQPPQGYEPYQGAGRQGPPMNNPINPMGYPPQHFMEQNQQQRGPGGPPGQGY